MRGFTGSCRALGNEAWVLAPQLAKTQTSTPITMWAEGVFQGHIFSSNVTHPPYVQDSISLSGTPGCRVHEQNSFSLALMPPWQSHVHFKWNLKPSRHAFPGSSHELITSVLMSLRSERRDDRNAQRTCGMGSIRRGFSHALGGSIHQPAHLALPCHFLYFRMDGYARPGHS